jgi:eukaryotic-like serine/threonine-protein kinase
MSDPLRSADDSAPKGSTLTAPKASDRSPAPLPTPTDIGRYVLSHKIAHGGMGVVYSATDTALNREVAVKVLRDEL